MQGIRFYSVEKQEKFGFLERSLQVSRSELYNCHLSSSTDECVYVGWIDTVQVVHIKVTWNITACLTIRLEVQMKLRAAFCISILKSCFRKCF